MYFFVIHGMNLKTENDSNEMLKLGQIGLARGEADRSVFELFFWGGKEKPATRRWLRVFILKLV